jgi:hypothetical protein
VVDELTIAELAARTGMSRFLRVTYQLPIDA